MPTIRIDTGLATLDLNRDRIVIGSVDSADVCLKGPSVSPIHAVIEVAPHPMPGAGIATLYDLASDSGVYVNGHRVATKALKSGDRFEIGGHELEIGLVPVAAGASATPTTAEDTEPQTVEVAPAEPVGPDPEAPVLRESPKSLAPPQPTLPSPVVPKASGHLIGTPEPARSFSPIGSELLADELVELFEPGSSAGRRALEVIYSWRGTILDVIHLAPDEPLWIGETPEVDCLVPISEPHQLVSGMGSDWQVHLREAMKGVIQSPGELHSVGDTLKRTPDFRLDSKTIAKLQFGEVEFFLRETPSPPKLKSNAGRDRDPFFFKVSGISAALSALLLGVLLQIDLPETLEAEKLPEKVATIIYQPEKFRYPERKEREEKIRETSKSVPAKRPVLEALKQKSKIPLGDSRSQSKTDKQAQLKGSAQGSNSGQARAQGQGKEGAGAKALGASGVRGKPQAKDLAPPQNKGALAGRKTGPGQGAGASQVEDRGNIDAIKGASKQILDLLGGSTQGLGKSGARLKGFGGFDTKGGGGQALSGTGSGGGGTSVTSAGLAESGRGGGKVGTGLGAVGDGSNILGGKVRVSLRRGGPEETVVMGSIDRDAIEAALLAHRDEFRMCYEREINQGGNPNLAGRVLTSFVIGASGRVTEAGVSDTTLKNRNTESCILRVIRRIDFPEPMGGGIVQVKYPFKFRPIGQD